MPETARFDAEAMLAAARSRGFTPSKRLLFDWVSLGLLDRPMRRGLGRGRGSSATWPAEQRELFLQLLAKRATVRQIAPLCNIPVWLWLYYGERYAPLRQVRRAIKTWAGDNRKTKVSWETAGTLAREITRQIEHVAATPRARRELRDQIRKGLYQRGMDRDALLEAATAVLDPQSTGQPRGPAAAQLSPESFVHLVEARLAALDQVDDASDELFEWARMAYLETQADYASEQPQFARDPDVGHLYQRHDLNEIVNRACLNLITLLGLGLLREGVPTTT